MNSKLLEELIDYLELKESKIRIHEYYYDKKNHICSHSRFLTMDHIKDFNNPLYEYGLSCWADHNPYVDFIKQLDCKTENLSQLISFLNQFQEPYRVYHSGNSFHVYFQEMEYDISHEDRTLEEYLAKIMLADREGLLDHRWAWHSIKESYSALRFTCNTDQNIKVPELVFERSY